MLTHPIDDGTDVPIPCHVFVLPLCVYALFVSFDLNPIDQIAIMFSSGKRTARDATENANYTKITLHTGTPALPCSISGQ